MKPHEWQAQDGDPSTYPLGMHDDEGDRIYITMKEIVGDSGVFFIEGAGD